MVEALKIYTYIYLLRCETEKDETVKIGVVLDPTVDVSRVGWGTPPQSKHYFSALTYSSNAPVNGVFQLSLQLRVFVQILIFKI